MGKPDRHARDGARIESEDLEQQAQVRLKPIFGVKPGTYLTVLYALGLLFVLFLLLFYKGLRDQGVYLSVRTYPSGAAVSVDGTYAGSSPCQVLVKKGPHRVTAAKPFFTSAVLEAEFPGPAFGTLFVRPTRDWSVALALSDPQELIASAVRDLAARSHIPEVMSETAEAAISGGDALQATYDFLDFVKFFVTSSGQLPEYVEALATGYAQGTVLSPRTLISIADYFIHLEQEQENSPLLLAVVLPAAVSGELSKTPWFQDYLSAYRDYQAALQKEAAGRVPSGGASPSVSVGGLSFVRVPGGTLMQGLGPEPSQSVLVPHPVVVESFDVSRTEVSNRVYGRFVQENPAWAKANLEQLVDEGQVSEGYLAGWQSESYTAEAAELPVSGVSYYAAEAFCQWLTRNLPSSLVGYEARLPLESEWEWAARGGLVGRAYPRGNQPDRDGYFTQGIAGPRPVGASPPNGYGLHDTAGNVWEWCLDWYSATRYVFSSRTEGGNAADTRVAIPYGAQKVIRGGGWANEKELVKVFTRGSQPPEWCTPYLGFRVVLAKADR